MQWVTGVAGILTPKMVIATQSVFQAKNDKVNVLLLNWRLWSTQSHKASVTKIIILTWSRSGIELATVISILHDSVRSPYPEAKVSFEDQVVHQAWGGWKDECTIIPLAPAQGKERRRMINHAPHTVGTRQPCSEVAMHFFECSSYTPSPLPPLQYPPSLLCPSSPSSPSVLPFSPLHLEAFSLPPRLTCRVQIQLHP